MNRPKKIPGTISWVVILGLTSTARLVAQTNDQSRLTIGISAGYIGSQALWDIPNQPIASTFEGPDLYHLHRDTHSDISISAQGTYFPGPHLGYTGEFTYVGLGNSDACTVTHDGGDAELITACSALNGANSSASTTVIQGGIVLRPLAQSYFQPYFKGLVGLAFTPSSSIAMASTYGSIADTALILTIYDDNSWKEIRPTWTAAFGISTAPNTGYQLRAEVRETWLALGVVTAATTGQGAVPPNKSAIKGFPSILVGFDIVLAKQRGRRY